MTPIEELYYMIGRLEYLNSKETVCVYELDFIKELLDNNSLLNEIKKDVGNEYVGDYDDDDYDDYDSDDYYDNESYMLGDPSSDPNENPWIEVFGEGEEAETAYWNTQ